MNKWLVLALMFVSSALHAEIRYSLTYSAAGDSLVKVSVVLTSPRPAPLAFIIPRNYPGGFDLVPYDSFVENVHAFSASGTPLAVEKARAGSRWFLGSRGEQVSRVEYEVDVRRMENGLVLAVESSKIRPSYVGLLGYSIFGSFESLEDEMITLQIKGPSEWPVYTTLNARVPAPRSNATAHAANYYALADSQVLMGPDLRLQRFDGAIALVAATYSEGTEDTSFEPELARTALERVQQYFGDTPFSTYTVQLEFLKPLPGHDYFFSQEHLESGTFSLTISDITTRQATLSKQQRHLENYAHHMAHSWIPKRAYGEGNMPFVWELPPVIDTIWFNEGFGRYAGVAAVAEGMEPREAEEFRREELKWLQEIVSTAPDFIAHMPSVVLSREASFLYSQDIRIGANTFARGTLMAAEMDDRIRLRSKDRKSLKDGLRALVTFVQSKRRPFQVEELSQIIQNATGVDVSDIQQHWMQPSRH